VQNAKHYGKREMMGTTANKEKKENQKEVQNKE
jgi:hypothetical protein